MPLHILPSNTQILHGFVEISQKSLLSAVPKLRQTSYVALFGQIIILVRIWVGLYCQLECQ